MKLVNNTKPVEMYRVVARWPPGAFGGPGGAVVKRWTYSSAKAFEHAWGWLAPEIEKGEGPDGQ